MHTAITFDLIVHTSTRKTHESQSAHYGFIHSHLTSYEIQVDERKIRKIASSRLLNYKDRLLYFEAQYLVIVCALLQQQTVYIIQV